MQVGGNKIRMELCQRRGFTLIELLVVILIILLVSAVTLPTVIPAIAHRQVTEAARLLQGNLAGARNAAIHYNAPRGIRLLPDPAFFTAAQGGVPTLPRFNNGQIDTTKILAANRFVPIESAPDYAEGKLDIYTYNPQSTTWTWTSGSPPPYPGPVGSVSPNVYPVIQPAPLVLPSGITVNLNVLMVVQSALDPGALTPNSPTSWFWNIRMGDKIQIGGSGSYYTVVGPLTVYPGNPLGGVYDGNPELFVNDGTPGTIPGLTRTYTGITNPVPVEYLFLVNGVDDDGDGFVDDGWDSVDNNNNHLIDELDEWENEKWTGALSMNSSLGATSNLTYNIRRRPVPTSGVREIALPSNIVVDLTTASTNLERSRLPVNAYTGYFDVLLNPTGDIVPTTIYSSPSSVGLGGAFLHFWLAERGDLFDPLVQNNVPYLLPMPSGTPGYPNINDQLPTRVLKGERRLVTLNTRTGLISISEIETFDATGLNGGVNAPFLAPQQGVQGGP